MEKIDARKLTPKEQFEIRKRVIKLREKGYGNKETAAILELSQYHTSRLWQSYLKDGIKGIGLKRRGRPYGSNRTLTMEQEQEIKRVLIDKTPDQMKFPWALWTREAICALIKRKYGIEIPIRSISHYLKRWNFTFQRPVKRAYKQSPEQVEKFLTEEYPLIAKRARLEKAEIYWGDETGIQNTADYLRGFAPKGQKPVLLVEPRKRKVNMFSAITNSGTARFMLYEDNMNQLKLIEFMKRLVIDVKRKVYLILDNLKAHHGKVARAWLDKNKDKIEVFFLPSYAPEYNPTEYLNHDLKLNVHSGKPIRTTIEIKSKVRSFMKKLQLKPQKVMSYFKPKYVRFAAQGICYV